MAQTNPNNTTQTTQNAEGAAPTQSTRRTHFSSTAFATLSFLSESEENAWLKNRILFDPQAQSSSFCNKDFVTDIVRKQVPVRYTGQAKGHDVATQEGLFMNMIKVDYNPEFATNILGGAEMRHIYGFDWSYDRSSDIFYLNVGEKRMVFNMENYLYAYDPTDDYEMTNVFATMKTKDQKEQIPEVLGINNTPSDVEDDMPEPVAIVNMTIEETATVYGEELAEESLEKEFQQYIDKKTLRRVLVNEVIPKDQIIPFKAFAKEKKDADGNFKSLKTRGVARGDRQKPTIYEKISSPTASTQSLFTVITIGAYEGKKSVTYDFPGAYLNATREGRAPRIFLKLNKFQTQVMTKLDPTWKEYTLADGTSRAEITGALYGLIESGGLWNQDVVKVLERMSLKQSLYDPCVFQKPGMRIVLYVDDLYITYDKDEDVNALKNMLVSEYGGEFKFPIDGEIEFLGMKFLIKDKGVQITMPDKIEDVIQGINSSSETPAAINLFDINDESPLLEHNDKSHFHTLVAKLLYISKRIRPDILLAVNFLTTRVQSPTEEDWKKLTRVLKYLRGTKDRALKLKIGKSVFVHAYIDASYGVHDQDGKSHTGATIGIGDALAILVKSTKQKIVTKSSTEAELIAVTDTIGDVIDLKGFVQELGYELSGTEGTAIYQDNQSTIQLMKTGPPSSSKSKHVRIRTFWLREQIENGDIRVMFKPTEEMIADGLTKPLQGAQFKLFADHILGGE